MNLNTLTSGSFWFYWTHGQVEPDLWSRAPALRSVAITVLLVAYVVFAVLMATSLRLRGLRSARATVAGIGWPVLFGLALVGTVGRWIEQAAGQVFLALMSWIETGKETR